MSPVLFSILCIDSYNLAKSVLEIISDRHKEWVYLVECFGCNKETAEDIVQDMYIKMHKIISRGADVMYSKTEINSYYVLKTLKSIFIDHTRKHNVHTYDVECFENKLEDYESIDFDSKYDHVLSELAKLYFVVLRISSCFALKRSVSNNSVLNKVLRNSCTVRFDQYQSLKKVIIVCFYIS
jgi:hypothetical protein